MRFFNQRRTSILTTKYMRTILIDPTKRTITNHELPEPHELEHLYSAMDAHGVDVICLGKISLFSIDLWVDDEGLMNIPCEAEPPYNVTQGFFVLHNNGNPQNLVAGKALVAASDGEGDTIGLPDIITPEEIAAAIAFIPDHKRNEAAEIAEDIIGLCGCVVNSDKELDEIRARNAELVAKAMELTQEMQTA